MLINTGDLMITWPGEKLSITLKAVLFSRGENAPGADRSGVGRLFFKSPLNSALWCLRLSANTLKEVLRWILNQAEGYIHSSVLLYYFYAQ